MKKLLPHLAAATLGLFLVGFAKADTAAVNFSAPGESFNNGAGYSVGFTFTTTSAITVDGLGYYDNGGLTEVHQVGIYNSSGVLLATTSIDGTGTQVGFFNFESITPLILAAGQNYEVMGSSGLVDPYAFDTTGLTVAPGITFDQDAYANGNSLQYGDLSSGITAADGGGYFGADFEESSAVSTTPEPGSLVLLCTGMLGLAGVARRRFQQ